MAGAKTKCPCHFILNSTRFGLDKFSIIFYNISVIRKKGGE
jgi:hypothetical protein